MMIREIVWDKGKERLFNGSVNGSGRSGIALWIIVICSIDGKSLFKCLPWWPSHIIKWGWDAGDFFSVW